MKNFYVLKYDTENLGDDIQSIATMDILQDMSIKYSHVYRDMINGYDFDQRYMNYIIFNGWFTNGYGIDGYYKVSEEDKPNIKVTWPPQGNFTPILYSFHISEWGPRENRGVHPAFLEKSEEFYRSAGEVGCRDNHTLKLLQSLDVPSYFSGCITLSLDRDKYLKTNVDKDEILIADISSQYHEILIKKTKELYGRNFSFKNITHSISSYSVDLIERFTLARRHLEAFCNAKLVFTSRLHVALPCLAFGTPVIFIVNDEDIDNSRYCDYLPFMNVMTHSQVNDADLNNYIECKYDGQLSKDVKSKFEEIIKNIIA